MWGDNEQEVVPVQPGEAVCTGCRLVYRVANKSCTNCDLWGNPMLDLVEAALMLLLVAP